MKKLNSIILSCRYNIDGFEIPEVYINLYHNAQKKYSNIKFLDLYSEYKMNDDIKYIIIGLPKNYQKMQYENLIPYAGIKIYKNQIIKQIEIFYGQFFKRSILK